MTHRPGPWLAAAVALPLLGSGEKRVVAPAGQPVSVELTAMSSRAKETLMRRSSILIAVALAMAASAGAQVAAPAAPKPAPPTLAQVGMFIYPAQKQTPAQQAADEQACTRWAESQTGLELQARPVDTEAAAKAAEKEAAQQTEGAAVAGAAAGAVAGVAIGAIAGNTGKGAAIGAAAGAMGGLRARQQAKAQAGQQGAQQAQAQSQKALDTFKKAAGACLEGRGYTVK